MVYAEYGEPVTWSRSYISANDCKSGQGLLTPKRTAALGGASRWLIWAVVEFIDLIKLPQGLRILACSNLTSLKMGRALLYLFVSYFFFHFGDLPIGLLENQISREAMLLHGALKFHQKVVVGEDVGRGNVYRTPFKYMHNSCRVSLPKRDMIIQSYIQPLMRATTTWLCGFTVICRH